MHDSEKDSKLETISQKTEQSNDWMLSKENILSALGCKRSDFISEDYSDDGIFE